MIKKLVHFSDLHIRLFKDHELYKSINTLSYVINHMETELKSKCMFLDESEWEKNHFVKNFALVAELRQSHSQTVTPCTASAANAVGVVFRFHGQAVVEHVRDGGHINATCCHIGGHQNLHLTLTQCHQTAVAQALAQSTVQRDR